MEIKFDVYFKKNLGTLCKDNEVDLDGKEAHVNLDLNLVERLEANYIVGTTKYTDEVTIKDVENKEILIPFKSDVVKTGLNEFEIVAYMKNGDIKVSQTYTYKIEKGIGEGSQAGSGGVGDGHTHLNLTILNSITQAKVDEWDNKSDKEHTHDEYANKNDVYSIAQTDNKIREEISKIELKEGPKGDKGADGVTTSIVVNGNTYTHVDGVITLPNYPTSVTGGSDNAIDISIEDAGNNFVAENVEDALSEVSSQIKDIAYKTIVENGKLYLVREDGTKIDSGTTLPIGGNSAGDNTSSGTYDTEISLPYTANSDTDVELTFSAGSSVSYTNLCPDGSDISQYTIQNNGTSSTIAEIISDSEKGSCLHYKNGGTSGYSGLSLFSSNTWDSTHYYYVSYWVKMVTKSTNYPDYPSFNCGTSELGNINTFNRDNLTSWQRVSFITQPASYLKTNIGFNIQADGEFYFKPIIVLDMEGLGYDLSSSAINGNAKTYIADLDTKVLQANNGFSCVVKNGSNTENIEVFSTGNKIYYYTVANGNTLSINKRDGYNMPFVTAKVKGGSDIVQDIEDVDIKITTRFAGKKVVFEGDSITDSDYHEAYNGKSWADYLANKLKMTIASNMALGGSSISTYNSAGSVVNRITSNSYPSDTKLFCIMAGTNDWNSDVALGDITSTDTSTILGALNTIIDHLQTNYPDATIVIMTPMHRSGMRTATRTAGTLSDVATAYEEVCMNWGVNCINTLKEFGMNAYNTTVANKFYVEQNSDWLHPNPAGHKRIAIRMAGYISTL